MTFKGISISLLLLLLMSVSMRAESVKTDSVCQRPIESNYIVSAGSAQAISTYLSPLKYSGSVYGISGEWNKIFNHCNDRLRMAFEADITYSDMLNPSKMGSMLGLQARFGWGLQVRFMPHPKWEVSVGGMAGIEGGALYLIRNGNNPVTALADFGIDIAAAVRYNFRLGSVPVQVRDELRVPTASIFFSPQYGESYYEIWLGNHDGLAHGGWWGNRPGLDNRLTARFKLGNASLIVGYRFALNTYKANHLATQIISNSAMLGISF